MHGDQIHQVSDQVPEVPLGSLTSFGIEEGIPSREAVAPGGD